MHAITIRPHDPTSLRLDDVASPPVSDGSVLVRALSLGICGTDREIVAGHYGDPPAGEERLIIGHESLGRVEQAPSGCGFDRGDLVVGIVRRPDPVPCPACAAGEWDMCRNGRYTERGIKSRHGYGAQQFRVEPDFLIKLDPALDRLGVLLEPTSVVAKAWEHALRIATRGPAWRPRIGLVTGAGPVGLLAAMMGVQHGLEMHVFDRATDGPKPGLVRQLGAVYRTSLDDIWPDIVIECTGAGSVVRDVMDRTTADGVVCLAGLTSGSHELTFDIGDLDRSMVLENHAVFGSVNANRRHYAAAAAALAKADRDWLAGLITRRVPLSRWREAFERRNDDIKVVLDFD
ncbi:theronine dehydrogenase [Pseudolabrys taiwanensis]|uniref:Theronine dehydrogenase n=1 Tax=Pseudolabrys taiwanensis TaxID=331696 RepID=A0A345ZVQ3_9HYPH|nr:glucose 1-dehydrogenase [Pseudolabrys taiwanensis]AXK81000.1 theronine dehydrogenase [Pseudolabrys taiwanensis]